MLKTVASAPARWADSTTFTPGLASDTALPVLCCPLVGVVTALASGVESYAAENASNNVACPGEVVGGNGTVTDAYASCLTIVPGRVLPHAAVQADDASVDDLLAAAATRI